jgi:endo-alpha-1,4-polygalactosaminidase (GH114 family)
VLVVDYVSSQEMVRDAYTRSRARGYVSTVTVVDLDRLLFELW